MLIDKFLRTYLYKNFNQVMVQLSQLL